METEVTKKSLIELSNDARILINLIESRLIKGGAERVTYAEMSAAIGGRNVQAEARHLLGTARRAIQKEHKVLIDTITNEGICVSSDYAGLVKKNRRHIRRITRRTNQVVLNAIQDKTLDDSQQLELMADLSLNEAMLLLCGRKAPAKLLSKIKENQNNQLPTAETIRLYLPNGSAKNQQPTTSNQ